MKPKSYKLISECVDRGIKSGWNKAHKHTDNPSDEEIKNQIENYIMLEISEWFDFEEKEIPMDNDEPIRVKLVGHNRMGPG